jgi:predicted nucleotidyltransferase
MRDLHEYKEKVSALCKELGVERLDIFGSATREDFASTSDIDVIARFDRRPGRMFGRYFDLKERLEEIFNRSVDVILEDSIRNPYFREALEQTRVNVYES